MFNGKTILITGGTGSFGSQIISSFLASNAAEVRIFSRDEKKQHEMRETLADDRINFYLGDVRDISSLGQAISGVDYIFHAAALKHVPSCEFYPMEAIKTNVIGTDNVLDLSIKHNVRKAIFLSTDKAVYPINAMGLSKALMEKTMMARARHTEPSNTVFCATRYGNVMTSRGSVIPLFVNQIKSGLPITVTDPKMTRFLMSLEESVDLVIKAFSSGLTGDVFIQKAPAATVENIALALKDIFSSSAEVRVIGTRHGEKQHETLVSREERQRGFESEMYFQIPLDNRSLNYASYLSEGKRVISETKDYTSQYTKQLSVSELKTLFLKLPFIQNHISV